MGERVDRQRAWFVTALLFLFMYINFADKAVIGLAAVPMMRELHLLPDQWGTVGSSFFLLFPVSALIIGFVVNRVRTRPAMAAMAAIWALAQFPMLATGSVAVLIACRIMLGAGEGPAYPVALHAAYKWFPDVERTLPTSIIALGSAVGVLSAAPFLVWLIEAVSWRVAFALLGVLGLIWVVLWLAFGKEGPLTGTSEAERSSSDSHVPYGALLASRTVIGVLVCGFAVYWSLALLLAWVPAFLRQGLGYGVAQSTLLITLVWSVVAILIPLIGWLAQRASIAGVSSRVARGIPAGLLALAAGAATVAAVLLPPGILQFGLLLIGYSIGGGIFTLGPAMIAEITPAAQRSALLGITTAVQTVAGIVSPIVTGYIVAAGPTIHDGYVRAFIAAGVVTALGGLIGMILMRPETDLARLGRFGTRVGSVSLADKSSPTGG